MAIFVYYGEHSSREIKYLGPCRMFSIHRTYSLVVGFNFGFDILVVNCSIPRLVGIATTAAGNSDYRGADVLNPTPYTLTL